MRNNVFAIVCLVLGIVVAHADAGEPEVVWAHAWPSHDLEMIDTPTCMIEGQASVTNGWTYANATIDMEVVLERRHHYWPWWEEVDSCTRIKTIGAGETYTLCKYFFHTHGSAEDSDYLWRVRVRVKVLGWGGEDGTVIYDDHPATVKNWMWFYLEEE